jgi:hypothetical protein
MRAPGVAGKATVMPFVSPLPPSSRVPWVETSCALVLHLTEGIQLTLVIRTVRTCRLVVACLEADFFDGVVLPVAPAGALVEPVGAVPPGLAASARGGNPIEPIKQHSSAETITARKDMDRWGAPFANKKIPPRRKT